jgi:hypothetical protein
VAEALEFCHFENESDRKVYMNAEQRQKWGILRAKGLSAFLLKRILLWGTPLSLVEIAISTFIKITLAKPMADSLFNAVFSKERFVNNENPVTDFILDHHLGVLRCFLLAGFIAFAVWTYKEQSYHSSATVEPTEN